MKRIAIIDGNSLINRAYYAMRNPMITRDGIYTHAIFGFINMLDKIRKDYEPEYMAVAFDMSAPTFRHKEYEEYKAGRKKMPPELAMQIPLLKDILDAMSIKRIEIEGFEADDIIGTIARAAEAEGLEPYIVTGDRDQLQLATDITKIIYTKRGVSDFDLFDHDAFVEAYGFTPLQFIDYKGLSGDSSDNIPGVPGVGAKTATKLIQEYGSVENIIENAENIKPDGLKNKISDNTMQAMMSKRLATINVNVPIETDMEQFKIGDINYDALIDIYTRLEFNRFLSRLKRPEELTSETMEEGSPEEIEAVVISSANQISDLKFEGDTIIHVFGNNDHLADPIIERIGAINGGKYYVFEEDALNAFYGWIDTQEVSFVGHDLINDYYMLMCKGVKRFKTGFDIAVAQYVIDSGRSNYKLEALANEYIHYTPQDAQICQAIGDICSHQKDIIIAQDLESVLYDIELPLIEVMASMELEGFKADRSYLEEYGKTLSGKIEELSAMIQMLAGEEFNINSTQQLGEILFDKLELPHGKKTKRGYSTSVDVLEKIKDKHPIIPNILEYRTLSKLKSTYIDGLIPLINEKDSKIRAHFQQTVAATGRISCTEPNLQNIPIRQELGRKLRKAFVPENETCVLVGADYSQIELRVLAHMSGDEALIKAFNDGEDIHRATAANVLGVPEDQITVEERSRAKAVNFGVIYGMSAFGLSSNLHITQKDANEYIQAYFAKHKQVKEFMDESVAFCKENGYVTTMMGRKRYIKEINASQYMLRQIGERLAMNTPIQGTAADIIKIAMIKVYNALKEQGLKSKLILQIHDELIINTYPDEKETVKQLLVSNMESACEMSVELKAELNEGKNWYELK